MSQAHYEIATNDMGRIIISSGRDPLAMSDEDKERWIFWHEGFFHMLEGYYHEYQEGQLSKEFMERYDGWIAGMMSLDHYRAWWESERIQNRFTDSFLNYVDGLIANPPESRWRWRDPTEVFEGQQ